MTPVVQQVHGGKSWILSSCACCSFLGHTSGLTRACASCRMFVDDWVLSCSFPKICFSEYVYACKGLSSAWLVTAISMRDHARLLLPSFIHPLKRGVPEGSLGMALRSQNCKDHHQTWTPHHRPSKSQNLYLLVCFPSKGQERGPKTLEFSMSSLAYENTPTVDLVNLGGGSECEGEIDILERDKAILGQLS